MDVGRLNSQRDEEGIAQFITEYEHFKFPYNISYPKQLKYDEDEDGNEIVQILIKIYLNISLALTMSRYITKRNLKFVQISITTSTLDNIKKVRTVSLLLLL